MSSYYLFHDIDNMYMDPVEIFNLDDLDLIAARCYGNDFNDEDDKVLVIITQNDLPHPCPVNRSMYNLGETSVYNLHCELIQIENTKAEELPLLIGSLKNKRADEYLERLLKGGEHLKFKYAMK